MKKQERQQKYDQIREMYEPVVRAKNYAMRQMIETGKKMGKLRYLMLAVLFIFLFTYHFFFAIFTQLKMREKMARAFSMVMVVVLVFTSVDVTVFAATWNEENGKDYSIVSVEAPSDDLLTQKLPVGATEDQIRFPETLTVTVVDNTAPIATATPEVTEQPTVTEAPATVSPEVTDAPETTEAPETTDAPETTEAPEVTETPDVTESPVEETPSGGTPAEPDTASENAAEQPVGEVSRAGQILSNTMNLLFPVMKVYAAENIAETSANVTETVTVTWKLDEGQSSGSRFDSGTAGNKYVYVPVFPEEYMVQTGVPAITVEIVDAAKVLTRFAALETTVANQEIRLQGSLKDLTFPESIRAQVEEYADGALISASEADAAVTWKWKEDRSKKDLREMDSFETLSIGDTYVYEAVLADGTYSPAEGLEYPTITIRVVDTPAFEQSVTVDGVTITVTADEGVLPEGASVKAKAYEDLSTLYTTTDLSALENYVQGFDVSVVDKKGAEIQPDTTKGEVRVHFSNPSADGSVATGDWDIFHYDEEKNVLEALDTTLNEGKDEVTAATDSFSPFLLTARGSGNTYNLSNGSVTLYASRDDGAVITGSGTNRNIRIENDTNRTCTMTVTLQDINIERSIIFIETYKQTTNVIFNVVGSVQIYSKKQVTMQKNGGGVTNVYLNADNYFQRDGSYIFSLQDVSMSKKVIDGGINLSLYNGTVATTALSNFSLERKTFSQAVASGQKKAHRVYLALVGYTDILKDFETTEIVRAGLPYLVSEPNLRGKRFIGYYSRVLKSTGWFSFKYEEQTYPAGSYITLEPDMTNYFELQYEDILNTVNLNVTLDGNTWGGRTVELRQGETKFYDLTRSGSVYTNNKVKNGRYDVYVDGEDSYYDVTVDCDDQSIQVNQTIAYTSTNIQTRLDNSYSDAPGEVALEKDGRVYYTLAGNSGNHNRPMPNAALPLDIYVNNEDTEFDLTTGNANPVIDFYTMEMSITDDAPWTTATVQLKDADGIAVAKLEYDSTTGSNITVYKRIMQKDTEHQYTVYIDGVDTGKTVSVTNEGRKASFTYYTVKAKITGIPGCEINLTSGADRKRLYQDSGANTYTAEHVYKRVVDGAELDYRLIVVGTVDDNENIINSNQKQFAGTYHTVTYYNSKNTKPTNDGDEEQVAVRFLYVRDGSKISNFTGNVLRNGYTFSHWSTGKWSPATDMSSCPEFDYDTKIVSDINLYAVYQEPNISIGDLIYTDENGVAGGNGQYYRMENMVITGFSPSEEAIKYVNLVTKNTEKIVIDPKGYGVKSVQLGSAVQTAGSDGKYVITPGNDGDRLAIYFEPCVSMAKAQDLIRNIIVQPKEKVEHSMTVEVVDAGGEYVAANKVTGTHSTISNTLPQSTAIRKDDLTVGTTLNSGIYYITQDKVLDNRNSSNNALKINGNVYLYIPKGVTLYAYGGGYGQSTSKVTTNGGYAGIYVPKGSTLHLLGEGTVWAYGGNAGAGANGGAGGDGSSSGKESNYSGAGGKGGSGGGGAGAGIGTNGAAAISHSGTSYGNGGSNYGGLNYQAEKFGQAGNAGAPSRSAEEPGTIYIDNNLTLRGSGGSSGSGGSGGASGYFWIDKGSGWDNGWTELGAGGGGAGGGGGYAGALVGYGGASGAGGGGGASGGHYSGGSSHKRVARNGNGGQGGRGGSNGSSGDTNTDASRYHSYNGDTDTVSIEYPASGGSSGSSGSNGSNTRKPSPISMPTYSLTFDVSSVNGATKPTDITYHFGDSRTITMPEYVNSNPYVNFLGWEVKGYAGSETVSAKDPEFVQNKLGKRYLSGSSYTIAQGTYGNIELVAVTETLGGIYKKDAITPYTYSANAAPQQYYTYQVQLTKDDEPYTVGNIKIGDRTVSPDQNGKYSVMVAGTTAPQPLEISVNGEDAGLTSDVFDASTRISNTTVAFRSIRVLVEDSSEENAKLHKVELKSTSGGKAPILVAGNAIKNAEGRYVTEYTYVTLAGKATDEEYQIWIDGADVGQTVSYSKSTMVKFYTVTINIQALGFSPDQIGMVELRSGKERLFADFASQDLAQGTATFVYTKLADAEHNYQIYIDNVLAGEFTYNGNQSGEQVIFTQDYNISIEKKRYTTIVETYQDGQLRDSGVLKLDDRKMVRTETGRYEIVTDDNASSDLYVNGRQVKTGVEVGKSTPIRVNYYTIQYVLNDKEPNDMGELPKDRTIYLEGDSVTMPSGENLKNGGKTFVGWTIGGTTYGVGDTYSITGTTIAVATWKQTSFNTKEEKFYVALGNNEFTYNGEPQIPNIVVTRGKNTLNASTDGGVTGDYIVSFQNSNTCNGHNDPAGGTENTINAGTVTVTVTGINDYTGTLTATYGIRQREISVGGLKAVDKVYDGDPTVEMDVSSAYLEDIVEGDDVRFTDHATATTHVATAGNQLKVDIENQQDTADEANVPRSTLLTGDASANYTLKELAPIYVNVAPKQITADMFTLSQENYTYHAKACEPEITATDNQVINGETVNIMDRNDVAVTYVNNVNAGTATVVITADIATEEELAEDYVCNYTGTVEKTFTIEKAPLTITAKAADSKYSEEIADVTNSYEITGEIYTQADREDLAIKAVTGVKPDYVVGNYENAITIQYNRQNTNYDVTTIPADYRVLKSTGKLPLFAEGYAGVYDGDVHCITVTPTVTDKTAAIYYSSEPITASNFTTVQKTIDPNAAGYSKIGTHTIYYYATSEYYSDNWGEATVQITKRLLDITAKPQTVVYGDNLSSATGVDAVEIKGWANEKDQDAIQSAMQVSFTSDSYKPGDQVGQNYDVIPKITNEDSIVTLDNYQVKYHAGALTVEPRKVTFKWPVTDFVYTGKEQQIYPKIQNVLKADQAEVSVELTGEKATDAADYTAQVIGLTGAKAVNYTFESTDAAASQNWSITQAENAWIIEPAQPDYVEGSVVPEAVGSAKFGQVKFTYYSDETCTTAIDGAPTQAGTYWMKASGADVSANYKPVEEKITEFTVYSSGDEANKTQMVYATVQDKTVEYGSELPTSVIVEYKKQDGTAYTEADKDNFLAEGSKLTITTDYQQGKDVGEYHLTASGLAASEGYQIVYVPGKLTVTPKTVSLVWPTDEAVKTYNGLVQSITATLDKSSIYGNDDVSIGSYMLAGNNTNFADKVGEYTAIVQNLAGAKAGNYILPEDRSYSWEIVAATEVTENIFTIKPGIEDWYYGETPSVPVGESTLGTVEFKYQEVKDGVLDWNIFNWKTEERPTKPGTYRLIGYVDNGAGTKLECNPVEFQIKKAEVAVVIDSKESTYGTEPALLTSQIKVLRGQLTEEEVAEVQSMIQLTTEATSTSNAGEYPITVKDAEDNKIIGTDYAEGSFIKGKYTITNATMTVSAPDVTVTYDGKPHTIAPVEVQGDAAEKAVVYYSASQLTDDNYGSGSLVLPTITNVGEQTIYYYVKADNYEPVKGSARVTVTQKELKVTAKDAQIFFGEDAPDYTTDPNSHVIYEGFVDGENEQTLHLTPVFIFGKEVVGGWIAYTNTGSCGEYVIKPQLTGVDNYKVIYENGTLSVTKKDLSDITTPKGDPVDFDTLFTLEIPDAGYVYDGTEKEPEVSIKSQDLISVTENDYTVSYKNNVDAGTATVMVTATDQGNLSGTLEKTFVIGKREVTVAANSAESYYGENIAELSYNVTSGMVLEDDKEDLQLAAETSVRKGTAVGTYPDAVTVSYKENSNYDITVENADYTVKAKSMTVTAEDYTGVYDGKAHTGKVAVKTGTLFHSATVYYSETKSLDANNYTEASTDIPKYTDAGAVRTVYYYAVCEGYTPQSGQFTVTIENRPIALNWTLNKEKSQSAEVGETPAEVKASIDGNVVFGDHLAVTEYTYYRNDGTEITDEELNEALKQAGEYSVTATVTGEGAGNYVVSNSRFNFRLYSTTEEITLAENSIIDLTAVGWQYGAEHVSATAHAKYGQAQYTYYLSDGTTLTTPENSGAAAEGTEPVNPGEYQVKAVVEATESYKEASATQNFMITKANIRIIANDVTGQYGKDIADLSGEYTMEGNVVKGDDIKIALSTDVTKESPIGSYPITVSVTGSDIDSKYVVTTVPGTYFVVGAQDAIQVTAEGYAGTYDGESHGIIVKVMDKNGKPVNDVTVYYSLSELTDTNYGFGSKTPLAVTDAGETKIFYYVASDKYAAVAGSKIVNIAKKPVTVVASARTIVYGEDKPSDGSVVVNGLLGEDTLSSLNIQPMVSYQYEKYGDVGTYEIETTLSADETENYIFETQPGRLMVTPAPVTFRWSQASLSYTGEVQKMKAMATPLLNNDSVVVVLEQDSSQAVMPGEYVARVSKLSGDKAGNYTFDPTDATASQNWSIDQADNAFTTALSIEGWTYGETPKAPEAASRFGQVSFRYYKDALCEQPTGSEDGAATEGGVPENPGDYYVKAFVTESNEYAAIEAVEKFTIKKSTVTILVDNQYGALGDVPEELTSQTVGYVSGKNPVKVSLTLIDPEGNTLTPEQLLEPFSQSGNYKIAATADYDHNKYDVTIREGIYYVSENGISVTAKDVTVTYDAEFHNIEVVVAGVNEEEDYKVYYTLQPATDTEMQKMKNGNVGDSNSILTSSPECKSAGRTVIYYYVAYGEELYEGNAVVTINKAVLRVTANDCETSQGSTPMINKGVTYEGFVGGEDESLLQGQLSYQYSYTKDQPDGEYSITPKGLISNNYEFRYIPGKLTVLPVAVQTEIIGVRADNVIYDGETHTGYVGVPMAGDGEVTEFTYEYKTKDGTKLDGAPKDAGDYIVTIKIPNTNLHYKGQKDIAFTIVKRPIQVRLQNQAILLGQNFVAAKPEYVGFIGNDNENNKSIVDESITVPADAVTKTGKFDITYTGSLTEEAAKNYTLILPETATLTVFAIPTNPGKDESGSSVRLDEQNPSSGIVKIAVIKEEENLPKTEIEADFTIEVAEALLDEDEINAVKGGENALVYLLLSEAEQTITAEEKQKITELAASIAKDVNIGLYLDLSLYKKVGDGAPSKITQTGNQTVTIDITLPESLKVKAANVERTYYIIYVHDGKAKQITPQYKDDVLTFEASEFSVYTIAYKDTVETPTPTPTPGDNGTGGNTSGGSDSDDSGSNTPAATQAPAVTPAPGTTPAPASGSNKPQGGKKPGTTGSNNSTGQAEQPEASAQPETTAQPEATTKPGTTEQPGTTSQTESITADVKEKDKLHEETKKRLEEAFEKVTKVDSDIQAGPYVQPESSVTGGNTGGNTETGTATILVEIPEDLRAEGRTFYLMMTDADGNIIILPNESLEDGIISVTGSADAVYQIIYEDGGSTLADMLTEDGKLTDVNGKLLTVSTNHCLWHWLIFVITLLGLGAIALLGRKKKKYIWFFGAVTTVLDLIVAIIGFCVFDWIFLIVGVLSMLLLAAFLYRGGNDDSRYAAKA